MRFVWLFMLATIISACSSGNKLLPNPAINKLLPQEEIQTLKVGQDVLAFQHPRFPVIAFIQFMPSHTILGNLDWTFGTSLKPIKAALDSGKVVGWRVHFYNGPGLRNNRLGKYEPHHGLTIKTFNAAWERNNPKQIRWLTERVTMYCSLFSNYPSIVLEMSPTLEHDLSKLAWSNQAKILSKSCPAARIVNSPNGGVHIGVPYKYEGHGSVWTVHAPCNQSYDGQNATDADIAKHKIKFKVCDWMGIWTGCYNGLCKGLFVDPRLRQYFPSRDQLIDLFSYQVSLPNKPQRIPSGCIKTTPISPPYVWKPWAENTGDRRANKPVYISNFKRSTGIKVVDVNGKNIASLPLYGDFGTTQWRYYSGGRGNNGHGILGPQYAAHTFSEKAKIQSGESWIYLVEGQNCKGPFYSTYRQGIMR